MEKKNVPFWLNLALPLFALLFTFLLMEALVRIAVPRGKWQSWDMGADMNTDAELGWKYKPNLNLKTWGLEGEVRFRTNEDGVLPHTEKPNTEKRHVLLVGDSTVIGRHVPEGKRLHDWLQKELSQDVSSPVSVVNLAVEGYSTDQSLVRLERMIERYQPEVVIYGFCLNDLSQNRVSVAWGVPKLRYAWQGDELIKVIPTQSAKNLEFGKTAFRKWLNQSALFQMVKGPLKKMLGSAQEPAGVGVTDHFNLFYFDAEQTKDPIPWKLFDGLLSKMSTLVRSRQAKFLLYGHPDALAVWKPYREEMATAKQLASFSPLRAEKKLIEFLGDEGIFCPMVERMAAHPEKGPYHLIPYDAHANSAGYRAIAESLAACLSSS